MAFKDVLKNATKEMNQVFGIITEDDLSIEDRAVYNDVKNKLSEGMTLEEYRKDLNDSLSENITHMHNPEEYGKKLALDGDFQASTMVDKIKELEPKYQAAKAVLEEKKAAFEENDKNYQKLVALSKEATENIKKKTDSINKELDEATKKAEEKEAKRQKELQEKKEELEKQKELEVARTAALKRALDKSEQSYNDAMLEGITDDIMKAALESGLNARKEALAENQKKLEDYEKQISEIEAQQKDNSELQKDYQKNSEKYLKSKTALEKLVNEQTKRENDIAKAEKDHTPLLEAYKNAEKESSALSDEYALEREKLRTYGAAKLKETNLSISNKLADAREYSKIQERLNNTAPTRTSDTIMKGANALNNVYQSYKKSHWAISRFFRLPGTSAAADYKKFDALRTTYMERSGIQLKDINAYLDSNGQNKIGGINAAASSITEAQQGKEQITISNEEINGPEKNNTIEKMNTKEAVNEVSHDININK